MRRGARSIRGAMGAYFWAAVGALVVLGIVLWQGLAPDGRGWVTLPAASAWSRVTLDDGRNVIELGPGDRIRVPPGSYRIHLFGPGGEIERDVLEFDGRDVEIH